ncbi:SHOCT domain-containing protein [Flavisphingomonas formosensis]|uniref:SHOCT domain-containing protein n=1 Tax=Flavisphingomonas formosensis TaxID=861534 RepID=UPI0018DF7460|nr:SHOCT domain-containing protein [Sphingomonas formosensis]
MSDDHISKLERLARLREAGVLSDADFESEKAKILAEPAHPASPRRDRRWLYGSIAAGFAIVALVAIVMLLNPPRANIQPGVTVRPKTPTDGNGSDIQDLPDVALATPANPVDDLSAAFSAAQLPTIDGPLEEGFAFAPDKLLPIGEHYALISVGRGPQTHAGGGALAISYLNRTPDGFQQAARPLIVETGSFGTIGGWTLRRDLGAQPIIVLSGGGTWQGCTMSAVNLIELRAERPARLDAQIVTEISDRSDYGDGQTLTGSLSRSPDGIRATYTGSDHRTIDYIRDGDSLQPDSEPVEGC